MDRTAVVETLRKSESELRALGVVGLSLFGSVARGEARPESDIDVAIRLDQTRRPTLFDLAEVNYRLEALLGTKVDVLSEPARKPSLRAAIERDRVDVF